MGAQIGAMFGLLLVAVSVAVGLIFGHTAGAGSLCVIAYLCFAFVALGMFTIKVRPESPFARSLLPMDRQVLSMFGLFILTPGAATMYAGLLNVLRMALVVWGAICLWKGTYWWGGFSLGFFAVTSYHVPRLDPYAYLGPRAAKGHEFSRGQLAAIERIVARKEVFNQHGD